MLISQSRRLMLLILMSSCLTYLSGYESHMGIAASISILCIYQALVIGDVQRHWSSDPSKHWDVRFPLKFNIAGQTEGFYKSVSCVAHLGPPGKSLAEGRTDLTSPRSQDIIVATDPSFPLWSWSFCLVFIVDKTKHLNDLCIYLKDSIQQIPNKLQCLQM